MNHLLILVFFFPNLAFLCESLICQLLGVLFIQLSNFQSTAIRSTIEYFRGLQFIYLKARVLEVIFIYVAKKSEGLRTKSLRKGRQITAVIFIYVSQKSEGLRAKSFKKGVQITAVLPALPNISWRLV